MTAVWRFLSPRRLVLHDSHPPTAAPVQPHIKVVCTNSNVRSFEVSISTDTVDDVKRRIAILCGVDPDDQVVTHLEGGGVDDQLLCDK